MKLEFWRRIIGQPSLPPSKMTSIGMDGSLERWPKGIGLRRIDFIESMAERLAGLRRQEEDLSRFRLEKRVVREGRRDR
jgi:hypothetical protein